MERFRSFETILKAHGRAPALRRGEEVLTYQELLSAVHKRAARLQASSITCMGILNDSSLESVIEIFACVQAKIQVVMLEENMRDEVLKQLIRYGDIDGLYGPSVRCHALSSVLSEGVKGPSDRILFFTSGTTSASKAVVLTQESLCASAFNGSLELPLKQNDTLLSFLPLSHVYGFVCGLLWPLYDGACVCLMQGRRHIADDCGYYHPSALTAVPSIMAFLLKHDLLNPELKTVLIGSGSCPDEVLAAVKEKGIHVSYGYGLTEVSSGAAISTGGNPRAMTVCHDFKICFDSDHEILLYSPPCMMQGYYKHPEDTEEVLQDGWLHTGDLGFLDEEGKLHLIGRKKDILVLEDGTKIFLPEYEAELEEALGEKDFALVLIDEHPMLYIHTTLQEDEIKQKISALMRTKPISHRISAILSAEQEIPLGASGKKIRWQIQKEAEQCWKEKK